MIAALVSELEENGLVRLPELLTKEQLRSMQLAFEARLRRMRWNDADGYERTELYRHMVQDVLTLDQGFVDIALHPIVKEILGEYLGSRFELVEAKGWKSLTTRKDFHGWHGDAWYDDARVRQIPREVKLALYLTDVRSGAFNYVQKSHRKQHPRTIRNSDGERAERSAILEMTGPAGTAFLFDTSGVHRQGVPMLEPRRAVFYDYHDPDVPIQKEDVDYYRYHPLLLNAAFLGDLSEEDRRILGFGNKTNYIHAFERQPQYNRGLQAVLPVVFGAKLRADSFVQRVRARLKRMSKAGRA